MKTLAVCVSGQFRELEQCVTFINQLSDGLSGQYDVDVFVDTWSEQGVSTDLVRALPLAFAKYVPYKYVRPLPGGGETIYNLLPELEDEIYRLSDKSNVTKELLLGVIKNVKDVRIDEYKDFKEQYKELFALVHQASVPSSLLPMFYKIYKCYLMARKYSESHLLKDYDFYMRLRPDQEISPDVLRGIDGQLTLLRHPAYKNKRFASDQFAVGNKAEFAEYCSIWKKLHVYLSDDYVYSFNKKGPESLVFEHLCLTEVKFKEIGHFPYPRFSSCELSSKFLLDLLRKYYDEGKLHKDLLLSFDSLLSSFDSPKDECFVLNNKSIFNLSSSLYYKKSGDMEKELYYLELFMHKTDEVYLPHMARRAWLVGCDNPNKGVDEYKALLELFPGVKHLENALSYFQGKL